MEKSDLLFAGVEVHKVRKILPSLYVNIYTYIYIYIYTYTYTYNIINICVFFYRLGFCIVTSSKDRGSSSEAVLKFLQNL